MLMMHEPLVLATGQAQLRGRERARPRTMRPGAALREVDRPVEAAGRADLERGEQHGADGAPAERAQVNTSPWIPDGKSPGVRCTAPTEES